MSATCSGHTNMPMTFVVWPVRPRGSRPAAPRRVAKREADPGMMRIERGDGDLADIAGSDGIAGQ
jgi:hypothetical protein